MPVFGARMVCDSGNYKLMKERNKTQIKRETSLGKYEILKQFKYLDLISLRTGEKNVY